MRSWYVSSSREQVFKPSNLLGLAAIAIIILVAITPAPGTFRATLDSLEADSVALHYARVLASLAPDDQELQRLLAQQYANLGRYGEAQLVLDRLLRSDPSAAPRILALKVLQQRLYAATSLPNRREVSAEILALIHQMDALELPTETRIRMAEMALELGAPQLAARSYASLHLTTGNPTWAIKTAEQWLASGEIGAAARTFATAASLPGNHKAQALLGALQAYLKTGDYAGGIALLRSLDLSALDPRSLLAATQFALAANEPQLAASYAAILGQRNVSSDLQDFELEQLADAALAVSDFATAEHWLVEALQTNPSSISARQKLSQLYEWSNRPALALQQQRWLIANAPEHASFTRAWEIAQSLYRYETVADILQRKSERTALTQEEIRTWTRAMTEIAHPSKVVDALAAYLDKHPDSKTGWRLALQTLQDDEQVEEALAWWGAFESRHSLEAEDHKRIAALHWMRFEIDAAIEALQQADEQTVAFDPDYWRALGELAWQDGDITLTNRAYVQLALIGDINAEEFDLLLATLDAEDSNGRRFYTNKAWEATGQVRFLLAAMEETYDVDREAFEKLLQIAETLYPKVRGSHLFWYLRAKHLARVNNPQEAQSSFEQALALAPNAHAVVTAYTWFLVEQRHLTRLWQLMDPRAEQAMQSPELAHAFGAGYMRLGRFDEASHWFGIAVAALPDKLDLAASYVEALKRTGAVDAAREFQHQALRQALARIDSLAADEVQDLSELTRGILSRPVKNQVFAKLYQSHPEAGLNLVLNDNIESQNWDVVRHTGSVLESMGLALDDYQRFIIAHRGRDLEAIREFTDYPAPTIRAEAQLVANETSHALQTSLAHINPFATEQERQILKGIAGEVSVMTPSGFRSSLATETVDTTTTTKHHTTIARAFDRVHARLDLQSYNTQPHQQVSPLKEVQESVVSLNLTRKTDDTRWQLMIGGAEGDLGTTPMLGLNTQHQIDQKNNASVALQYNVPATTSTLARAFARETALNGAISHQLNARNSFALETKLRRYTDHSADPLGRGWQVEGSWQHALFFAGPSTFLRASVSHLANNTNEPSVAFQRYVRTGQLTQMFPDRLTAVSVGASVFNGEPGQMGWRVRGPRYRLDADLSYQLPSQQPTFAVSASVGTRLFGDDELALQLRYATHTELGAPGGSFGAQLTYNYRFGR